MNRRSFVRDAALGAALCAVRPSLAGAPAGDAARRIADWLETLARPDGGYGWPGQPDGHLVVGYAVAGACHALGRRPPRVAEMAAWVRNAHPLRGPDPETRVHSAELKEIVYWQIRTLAWLGQDASSFAAEVRGWRTVSAYATNYEKGGNPILRQEMQPVFCRELLGLPVAELAPAWTAYLAPRRRADGSYNNTPASDGSGGHVVCTALALRALQVLGAPPDPGVAGWIERCQQADGGFTWCPPPSIGAVSDVAYTRAALECLALCGRRPARAEQCVAWLRSLWNDDGGFGDRAGAASSAGATHHALDCLAMLGADPGDRRRPPRPAKTLPADLRAYTIQIEAPGNGSPIEAVELARRLRIDLWGAKNAEPGWIECAAAVARKRGVAVTFFPSNEDYGTRVHLAGQGEYSHVNDPLGAPGSPLEGWARREGTWDEYRGERLDPLHRARGLMLWQICDNEEFSRILLDESEARGGFDLISTFHFGCHNMAWTLPFVMRYADRIPLVALQDAHTESWWWSANLAGFRTLFLAREPTWDAWLEAVREGRVAAVRRDERTRGRLRVLAGSEAVRRRVMERASDWQWWDDQGRVPALEPASVVALTPGDRFEPGAPEKGLALRVRLRRAWAPGRELAVQPDYSCRALKVDGREVPVTLKERKGAKGKLTDSFLLADPGPLPAGPHRLELDLLDTASKAPRPFESQIRID